MSNKTPIERLSRFGKSAIQGIIGFSFAVLAVGFFTEKPKPKTQNISSPFVLPAEQRENYVELKTDKQKINWQEFLRLQEEKSKQNHVEKPEEELRR